MKNGGLKRSTWRVMLARASAVKGFSEVRKGKPFDPDAYRRGRDQWSYERGRLLACVYDGKLKEGRRVTQEALCAVYNALYCRWLS